MTDAPDATMKSGELEGWFHRAWAWIAARYVLPYLFFARFPLLVGAMLVFGPVLGPQIAPEMLGNLFVMGWQGVLVVVFFGILCIWAVAYTCALLWVSSPFRNRLPFLRSDAKNEGRVQLALQDPGNPQLVYGRPLFYVSLLILPLAGVLIFRTDGDRRFALIAAFSGCMAAYGLDRLLAGALLDAAKEKVSGGVTDLWIWLLSRRFLRKIAPMIPGSPIAPVPEGSRFDATHWKSYQRLHRRATAFAAMAVFVYAVTGILFAPAAVRTEFVPPLVYVLALLLVLVWLFSFLSFWLDKHRIPVTLVLASAFALSSSCSNGHTYPVQSWTGTAWPSVRTVLTQRAATEKPLVIVTASGGGIAAAYWTTAVLRGIAEATPESLRFHDRVALISSVSGGGVGAMYYVNAFRRDSATGRIHTPDKSDLADAVRASGTSSLSASVWGGAYPDFLALWVPFFVWSDRGRAIEEKWELEFAGRAEPRLSEWATGVREGWRPIQVFNATLTETGERFVIAPVQFRDSTARRSGPRRRDFSDLYPRIDLSVVTAARLSATFPYISPSARADVGKSLQSSAYHVADGGYIDNSGIVTALETLKSWVDGQSARDKLPQVILIEVRTEGGADNDAACPSNSALMEVTAPARTMLAVRQSSQVSRAQREIDLLTELLHARQGRPTLHHVVFRTGRAPLSWHLVDADLKHIESYWPGSPHAAADTVARNENAAELQRLVTLLRGEFVEAARRSSTDLSCAR